MKWCESILSRGTLYEIVRPALVEISKMSNYLSTISCFFKILCDNFDLKTKLFEWLSTKIKII